MLVPRYWAEARIQKRFPDRQITVRRFGWSDESQEAAQQHADQRVEEAFQQIANGSKLPRREKKVGYGGTDGLPIREEILEEFEDSVVTRNSYGARCLNTPNVFIADIDLYDPWNESCLPWLLTWILSPIIGAIVVTMMDWPGFVGFVIALFLLIPLGSALVWLSELPTNIRGGREAVARSSIRNFVANHQDWHLRIYRSTNGFRLIALHKLFDPRADETLNAFKAFAVDKTYSVMCQKQNCFRARLTAKPWRIGIRQHMPPRSAVWPVSADRIPDREDWVDEYEQKSADTAACRFEEAIGATHIVDPVAQRLCEFHDRESQALSDLPTA